MSHTEQTTSNFHPNVDSQKLQENMAAIGRKILVLSGKGGVGKSTVAVNIAAEYARKGNKVGLLDVDLHGPSVPRMIGLSGQKCFGFENQIMPLGVSDNLKVMSVAFLVPDDTQAVIWRGPMKYNVIQQLLADTAWGELDYLVIDAPPGTGDEPLSVAQLVGTDAGAVIVTTPQKVAVEDVRRCITFCRQVKVPIWGIIENMAGFLCPHCHKELNLFGTTSGGKELADQTGLDLLGRLLFDPVIADGADAGLTIPECSVTTDTHKKLDQIIEKLTSNIHEEKN